MIAENVDDSESFITWTVRTLASERCSPELEALYVRLESSLSNCNVKMHYDELDNLFAELNDLNIGPEEVVPALDQILRVSAERALNICGVELRPDIDIEKLCEAIDVVCNFDPTDTPLVLIDALSATEDADEAFSRLMSYQGSFDEDSWFDDILEINPHFTKNVLNSLKSTAASNESVEISSVKDGDLLKRLSRLTKLAKDSLGAQLGNNDSGLGVSTESLYGVHVGNLIDKPVDQAVSDIFSLSIISNESYEVAMESVSRCLDDLFYEPDSRRQAEQMRIKYTDIYKPIFGGVDA